MAIFIHNQSRNIFGIDETKTKKVVVQPMTDEQIELCEDSEIEKKECFRNCYNIVMNNPGRFDYVLGAGQMGIGYEHAFIKDNNTGLYFDPTGYLILEKEDQEEMFVIKEYDIEELSEFIVKQGEEAYAPSFSVLSDLKEDMQLFVTSSQYFKMKKELEISPEF